jgi:hypothetical protein
VDVDEAAEDEDTVDELEAALCETLLPAEDVAPEMLELPPELAGPLSGPPESADDEDDEEEVDALAPPMADEPPAPGAAASAPPCPLDPALTEGIEAELTEDPEDAPTLLAELSVVPHPPFQIRGKIQRTHGRREIMFVVSPGDDGSTRRAESVCPTRRCRWRSMPPDRRSIPASARAPALGLKRDARRGRSGQTQCATDRKGAVGLSYRAGWP